MRVRSMGERGTFDGLPPRILNDLQSGLEGTDVVGGSG